MTRRVLVVDDEADIREVTAISLRHVAHWEVVAVDNGALAVEVARADRPDVVLLDVMMPGVDGESTARMLRADADRRDLPIILLTASAEAPGWAGEVGVAGVLTKPFDPVVLPAQIRQLLGWQ